MSLDRLADATEILKLAHINLAGANTALTVAKRELIAAENHHVRAGLEGKNEAARKAELDALTATERQALEVAELNLRTAQLELTLADLDYKLAREHIALQRAELIAQGGDNA